MRLIGFILCAAALTACNDIQTAVDGTARKGARGVVTEVLATQFPQVPKPLFETFTDCVIDNSTAKEVQEYVKASFRGVDEGTIQSVTNVLGRPETQACLQEKALSSGLL
jgi:hypothetical protein